ncbi:sorting nexin-30 [Tribolium castaneum]|uniref:Sorting nexin-30-like Protein n=2 Tax=Tribolium castaneum TaxID=7070 RepID=D6X250_TRICA|nr:PREDICTED: sorting nexin-30 [Tribolium castaneum]EFA09917.2 Sorting nexin-30-like Protein [Tribolium castaneum]|eukprot:XP_967096.2 PREDICTED: sorting nexin-30 [Tribolium castaneum]
MASNNTSAVLDIVVESKEISSILKDYDRSSICSGSTIDNSLVQSPSLESFSTIQDIENLSELNMDENSDLSVKIDNPQKHLETLETYITFRITTKVARIEYSENEYVVRRRYNDFIWLRQKLTECHPFCIVPPLPGKHSLIGQLDRYSKDFILLRMKALNVFVSRIVNHPILSCNEHFKTFLTAKQPDFNLHRRQRTNSENKIRTLSHSNSTHSALKNRHLEFDKTKSYLTVLSEKLSSIEKISSRINKERIDFIVELNSYHPIFTTWATSEPELAALLQNIGCAVERNTAAQNMLVQSYPTVIGNPIRDFLTYIDVVQDTIKKREAYQCAYENSLEELNKRHSEKDKLIASSHNPSQAAGFSLWKQPSCDEKLEKLGVYIPQLLKKVEANQDSLECANESLRSDIEHWQLEKQQCLKKILLDFVNKQIEYYQATVNAWEHVTSEIAPQNNVAVSK